MTTLTLEGLTKTFQRAGTVVDSVTLKIEPGEFFTLLGPSGCGKSTILRMVAGFEEPTQGRIQLDNRDITHEPPNRRGIGLVFQNYALFPHLSVWKNVAFGLELRRLPRGDVEMRVKAALEQVQLAGLDAARIDQLSGGQQQRVALARALVIRPTLLLLDEPLSNLDARLREDTRATLRALHTSTRVTTVYVTHDQAEAMAMSDRIAVLNKGRVQQVAAPRDIYERPANRFVASFIGRNNVLQATLVRAANDSVVIRLSNGKELTVHATQCAAGVPLHESTPVALCIRAEALRFADEGIFEGTLRDIEYSGSTITCTVAGDAGTLQVELPGNTPPPKTGARVRLAPALETIHVVDARDTA